MHVPWKYYESLEHSKAYKPYSTQNEYTITQYETRRDETTTTPTSDVKVIVNIWDDGRSDVGKRGKKTKQTSTTPQPQI